MKPLHCRGLETVVASSVLKSLTFFLLPRAACSDFHPYRIIRLVDTNSGRIVNEIKGHKGKVLKSTFLP